MAREIINISLADCKLKVRVGKHAEETQDQAAVGVPVECIRGDVG